MKKNNERRPVDYFTDIYINTYIQTYKLQKLFLFLRYSTFCNFFPSFPHSPDSKEQMEVE